MSSRALLPNFGVNRMPTKQLEGAISNEHVFLVWMVCPYVMVELDLCNECTEFVGYAHNFIYIKGLKYMR